MSNKDETKPTSFNIDLSSTSLKLTQDDARLVFDTLTPHFARPRIDVAAKENALTDCIVDSMLNDTGDGTGDAGNSSSWVIHTYHITYGEGCSRDRIKLRTNSWFSFSVACRLPIFKLTLGKKRKLSLKNSNRIKGAYCIMENKHTAKREATELTRALAVFEKSQ